MSLKIFAENSSNIQTNEQYASNTEVDNGFQPNTALNSRTVNSVLKTFSLYLSFLNEELTEGMNIGPETTASDIEVNFNLNTRLDSIEDNLTTLNNYKTSLEGIILQQGSVTTFGKSNGVTVLIGGVFKNNTVQSGNAMAIMSDVNTAKEEAIASAKAYTDSAIPQLKTKTTSNFNEIKAIYDRCITIYVRLNNNWAWGTLILITNSSSSPIPAYADASGRIVPINKNDPGNVVYKAYYWEVNE